MNPFIKSIPEVDCQTVALKISNSRIIYCFCVWGLSRWMSFRNVVLCDKFWNVVPCTILHYLFHIWPSCVFVCHQMHVTVNAICLLVNIYGYILRAQRKHNSLFSELHLMTYLTHTYTHCTEISQCQDKPASHV